MCTGLEMFVIGTSAFKAAGDLKRGKQEEQFANFQANQANADAIAEREAAGVKADKIRKAGKSQQSEARAALAASGVEVGAGTPEKIETEIETSAEEDALNEILYGKRKGDRLDQDAELLRRSGRLARQSSKASAFGSLLSAGGEVGKGWKTKKGPGAYTGNEAAF